MYYCVHIVLTGNLSIHAVNLEASIESSTENMALTAPTSEPLSSRAFDAATTLIAGQ